MIDLGLVTISETIPVFELSKLLRQKRSQIQKMLDLRLHGLCFRSLSPKVASRCDNRAREEEVPRFRCIAASSIDRSE
jgi:hypothetical protein